MTYPKLPKRFKNKWIAALRSGEYKQGTGSLRECGEENDTVGYCCLGVAAKVLGIDDAKLDEYYFLEGDLVMNHPEIPLAIRHDGELNKIAETLSDMNDGKAGKPETKRTFLEIANWIEENL